MEEVYELNQVNEKKSKKQEKHKLLLATVQITDKFCINYKSHTLFVRLDLELYYSNPIFNAVSFSSFFFSLLILCVHAINKYFFFLLIAFIVYLIFIITTK